MFARVIKKNLNEIIDNLLNNKAKVIVSSIAGQEEKTFKQLIEEADRDAKAFMATTTPGPFKTAAELPADWMKEDKRKGCSNQLLTIEKEFSKLNAHVYALNTHPSDYQCGRDGLLAAKKLSNLRMISVDERLANELGLSFLELEGKKYLAQRLSVVIKNGTGEVFSLEGPVDEAKAKQHVEQISAYILERKNRNIHELAMALGHLIHRKTIW